MKQDEHVFVWFSLLYHRSTTVQCYPPRLFAFDVLSKINILVMAKAMQFTKHSLCKC